jgi:hypothetical protein
MAQARYLDTFPTNIALQLIVTTPKFFALRKRELLRSHAYSGIQADIPSQDFHSGRTTKSGVTANERFITFISLD